MLRQPQFQRQYADFCRMESTRVYHTIPPSGIGQSGVNYDETTFEYDDGNEGGDYLLTKETQAG